MTSIVAEPRKAEGKAGVFFSSSERDELLQSLEHYSRYSDLLILLTGPSCSGKSQLLHAFLGDLPGDSESCLINAKSGMGASALLGLLVRYLGGDGEPRTLWLARQFTELAARGRSLVLAVDQAELLQPEALAWLMHFQAQVQANNWPLRILLVGRPEVRERLAAEPAYAEQVLPLVMAPLNRAVAGQFLKQLESKLGRAFPPCSDVQLDAYCRKAEDSFELLLEALKQHSRRPRLHLPQLSFSRWQYLMLGAAVTLLGSLAVLHALYGPGEQPQTEPPSVVAEIPIPVLVEAEPLEPVVSAAANETRDLLQAQTEQPVVSAAPGSEPSVASVPALKTDQEHLDEASRVVEPPVDVDQRSVAIEPADEAEAIVAVGESSIVQQPEKAAVGTLSTRPSAATREPAMSAEPAVSLSSEFDWSWLARQSQDGYVLQIMGSSRQSGVTDFVARHPRQQLLWYRTERKNKPWFVVIQGYYPTRAAAQSAAAALPKSVAAQAPWIRSLGQVINERR